MFGSFFAILKCAFNLQLISLGSVVILSGFPGFDGMRRTPGRICDQNGRELSKCFKHF